MNRYAAALAALIALPAAAQDAATVGLQLEPPHLDPTSAAAGAIDSVLYANVYEGLTRFAPDGSIVPGLAESWDISEDGLTYTFHLRDGVTFHDGSSFEAADVVFALDRARAEDSTNAQKALFEGIGSVEAPDERTLVVTLKAPDGQFLFNMAWGDAVVFAPEGVDALQTTPDGTGPFRFEDWKQGDSITLVRNEDYWGEKPALAKVTFKFISDPTAAFAATMSGDVDAFYGYPAPENLAQFEADPRFQVLEGSTEGETILAMNNARAPFDDPRVREAVALAVDRQAIIDGAMYGYGTPIGSHFAPHSPDYMDLTGETPHDPERAKALLAEAGHPDGFETTLILPPPSYARRGGEIVAAQLRAVGIEARIETVEWAQWLEQVFNGHDFDLTIVSHTEPFDIGIYARPDYYFGYDSEEFREIMADLTAATDPAERKALIESAQRRIAEDHVNAFLFELALTSVANAKLQGLWTDAPTQATDMTGVHWE